MLWQIFCMREMLNSSHLKQECKKNNSAIWLIGQIWGNWSDQGLFCTLSQQTNFTTSAKTSKNIRSSFKMMFLLIQR